MVDVDADDLVPLCVVLRQRTRAAAEVEDAQTRSTDERRDQPRAVVRSEDELLAVAVMRPVAGVEAFKPRHRRHHEERP